VLAGCRHQSDVEAEPGVRDEVHHAELQEGRLCARPTTGREVMTECIESVEQLHEKYK